MLMYIPLLEIMNQISDQFDIFSKDPLLKEAYGKISKGYTVRISWNY